ncbi:PREDICTED: retinol dehydrogenase 13-like [Papilio polytes]|uniref:retinol dehydrogenase 13-like n=1 Tax=Papilio polytes TaxID=76194 RepID=UPI0006767BA7|nr:PREDICTED: retinol dehydrogenase 13-like [Papilio polytes]
MCETQGRLDGKVAIVTGGSSGIGFEAAKNLAYRGARVIIASRNATKLVKARNRIRSVTGNKNVVDRVLDLGSLKSVRNFTDFTIKTEERLDVLVNNAGALGLSDRLTEDGLNLTMQVNYFGTFLLTYLLLPLLKASAPSRIINGVAVAMYIGHLDFDHWNDVGYTNVQVMANSKLAMDLFNAELSRRLKDDEVTANTFDPYITKDTDILNNMEGLSRNISQLFVDIVGQPKEDVGKQIAMLAADPDMANVTGRHYKFCREWINHWLAYEEDFTKQLWDASKQVVNITADEDWDV